MSQVMMKIKYYPRHTYRSVFCCWKKHLSNYTWNSHVAKLSMKGMGIFEAESGLEIFSDHFLENG